MTQDTLFPIPPRVFSPRLLEESDRRAKLRAKCAALGIGCFKAKIDAGWKPWTAVLREMPEGMEVPGPWASGETRLEALERLAEMISNTPVRDEAKPRSL